MKQQLTKQSLIKSFQQLGILPGTSLVVHSAYRNIGNVEGGADTVIDALLECIGKDGLLVVPTFTYNNEVFDPSSTPSRTGIITELLRNRTDSVRSLHPTHSVAAIGKDAEKVCEGHHLVPGLGLDSPLDRVAQSGGGVLLLGVGHANNSTIHVGEAYALAPYATIPFNPDWPTRIQVTGATPLEVEVYDPPGCSRAFGVIEDSLRRRGAVRDALIGNALVQWMPGQEVIDCTTDLLYGDFTALLCSDPSCYRCSRGIKLIKERLDNDPLLK